MADYRMAAEGGHLGVKPGISTRPPPETDEQRHERERREAAAEEAAIRKTLTPVQFALIEAIADSGVNSDREYFGHDDIREYHKSSAKLEQLLDAAGYKIVRKAT